MMHSTQFLYNIDPHTLKDMTYPEALKYKAVKGLGLQRELMPQENESEEVRVRLFYVGKALRLTRKLIEEME